MPLLAVLISALTTAIYFVYVSHVMKQRPGISSALTLAVSHTSSALALIPVFLLLPLNTHLFINPDLYFPLMMTGLLLILSRQLYFYAYANTDVANITVFSALTPIYTLATGYWFFREFPETPALVGLLVICGSIYALFFKKRAGRSYLAALLQPFTSVFQSKPVFCAFLSTIPTAFAAAYQKQLMQNMDPVAFSFALLLLIGLLGSVLTVIIMPVREVKSQIKQLPIHFYLMSMLMMPVMHIAFCYVIAYHQTAISLVLQRSSILFQIIIAYFFLREHQDITKRILVGVGILIGFLLIMSTQHG
jgi:drug/metabolite transporter (DMT)-like permease